MPYSLVTVVDDEPVPEVQTFERISDMLTRASDIVAARFNTCRPLPRLIMVVVDDHSAASFYHLAIRDAERGEVRVEPALLV